MNLIDKIINKLFPDVIKYNIQEKYSKLYIEIETKTKWDKNTAIEFQNIILDRNTLAYGGPFDFKCVKINKNLFKVTWNCYNVVD